MTDADEVPEGGHRANVSERKFNGTATLEVVATSKRAAKAAAKQYFKETHGSRAAKAVAEESRHTAGTPDGEARYMVRVSDHSSGSHADSKTYDFDAPNRGESE